MPESRKRRAPFSEADPSHKISPSDDKPLQTSKKAKSTTTTKPPPAPKPKVYMVIQDDDSDLSDGTCILGTYASIDSANEAAREELKNLCNIEDDEDLDSQEGIETSLDEKGLLTARAELDDWDDCTFIEIKVTESEVQK
ncbi:hypothetical protein HDV00_008899 [Rhizophlyctis rosea]|nr:hypothetical protein HDV00_008899 [Rhizophlyctis rosea]